MLASEEILTLVHAFPDEGRKESLRALAARVRALEAVASFALSEADSERLLADLERHCSPEEAKRRTDWAREELKRLRGAK
jgi:hypothetical protein